jgi:aspartate aminotransferase
MQGSMLADYLRPTSQSMTLLINEHCRKLEAEGTSVVRFGFGQSPFPPVPAAVQALRENAQRKEYAHVAGLLELRQAVASFHAAIDGTSFGPDDVFIGPGSKQMILNLMMCFTELNVYIAAPAWVSYEPQAKLLGHSIVKVRADASTWRPTAETLEEALRQTPRVNAPKLFILNNPGNPDGRTETRESLERIAAVCRDNNVIVLADEIYGLLNHSGEHVCFATLYDKTVVLSGLSKWCGAGGWRIGAFLFSRALAPLTKPFQAIASESYSCVATPVQLAAVAAYQVSDEFWKYIRAQRKFLAFTGQWAARQLRAGGVAVNDPQGAFYLFIDFTPIMSDAARKQFGETSDAFFTRMLQETGAAVLAGAAFGMPADQFCARLAYVTFDGEKVLRAIGGLGEAEVTEEFLDENAPLVAQGIRSIAAFARRVQEVK